MEEYSIDKALEQKDEEEPEYKQVGTYTINLISNKKRKEKITYNIETFVSKSGELGWTKSKLGAINPQNVNLKNIKRKDIGRIIHQTYPITEKKETDLKLILKNHKSLVEKMLADYIKFDYKKEFKK